MASPEQSSGLNAGYVGALLEQYLENPHAVDPAWQRLFEDADEALLATLPASRASSRHARPGLGTGTPRSPSRRRPRPRSPEAPEAADRPSPRWTPSSCTRSPPRWRSSTPSARTGISPRSLDPLGSEPLGDPALDETELEIPLTPELQARIPASLLRRARRG